jgi:hypothetical protein
MAAGVARLMVVFVAVVLAASVAVKAPSCEGDLCRDVTGVAFLGRGMCGGGACDACCVHCT